MQPRISATSMVSLTDNKEELWRPSNIATELLESVCTSHCSYMQHINRQWLMRHRAVTNLKWHVFITISSYQNSNSSISQCRRHMHRIAITAISKVDCDKTDRWSVILTGWMPLHPATASSIGGISKCQRTAGNLYNNNSPATLKERKGKESAEI